MEQGKVNTPWPEALVLFPVWNRVLGKCGCTDVGEYEGVKLCSLYMHECSPECVREYRDELLYQGYTEKAHDKFTKISCGVKLCVDFNSAVQKDGGVYIFFSMGRAVSSPMPVTPRVRAPGWRKDRRVARRSNRKMRRIKNRSVRKRRRFNRRSDRRMRREEN